MAEEKVPQARIAPFGLRMQPELKERIEKAAIANQRSMNAEIVARLEESFDEGSAVQLRATIEALKHALDASDRATKASYESAEAAKQMADFHAERIGDLEKQLQRMTDATLTFGMAFQEAVQGNQGPLEDFLRLAREGPLPTSHPDSGDDEK